MNLETHLDRWWFNPEQRAYIPQANEISSGRARVFLYESLYRCITKHDLYESFQLVRLLPKVTNIDPYALFRFIMILIESNSTDDINKNVIIHLEGLVTKLFINTPDIFIEFVGYFIKNSRIEDAKELFSLRSRYMTYKIHQRLPIVDINLKCYEFLFNYLAWNEKYVTGGDIQINRDVSFQGRLVNIIDCLKSVKTNHEYFVMCLLKILLANNYDKKAYLFASEFHQNNPNNMTACLIHYHILERLNLIVGDEVEATRESIDLATINQNQIAHRVKDIESINNFTSKLEEESIENGYYPIRQDRINILKNLRRLDPSCVEVIGNLSMHDNLVDTLKDLMDGMEVVKEFQNVNRWLKLKDVLEKIFVRQPRDDVVILDARFLWHTRYRRFWRTINYDEMLGDSVMDSVKELIIEISKMLLSKLDRPIASLLLFWRLI